MNREINELIYGAKEQINGNPNCEQVIVVKTQKSNLYYLVNRISTGTSEESAFLQMLTVGDDVKIKYILCMWDDYSLDVPSSHFRKMLLELTEDNLEAEIILQGETVFAKKLKATLPPCLPSFKDNNL